MKKSSSCVCHYICKRIEKFNDLNELNIHSIQGGKKKMPTAKNVGTPVEM